MDLNTSWKEADFSEQRRIAEPQIDALKKGNVSPVFASFVTLINDYVKGPDGLTLLDCACTAGYYYDVINSQVKFKVKYTGSDLAEAAISIAKERHPGGDWRVADITNLPFADQSYDLVMVAGVLEHVPLWRKAIDEVSRVASKFVIIHRLPVSRNGHFFSATRTMYAIPTAIHVFPFHEIVEIMKERDFLIINSVDTYGDTKYTEQSILFKKKEHI